MPSELHGASTNFMCSNRSKKYVAINLKSGEGQDALRRLAAKADILVENFRSRALAVFAALAAFSLDPKTLTKLNPRMIYCSISSYGRTGPRAEEGG